MRNPGLLILSILLALTSIGLTGCFYDHHNHHDYDDAIVGSGRIRTEQRTAPECSGLRIEGTAKVYLRQGTAQSIEVEADDNIIDDVVTEEENGILVVGLQGGSYHETTVNLYVTLPQIDDVEISGAGDITGRNNFQSASIRCHIDGTGRISISGTAASQIVVIDGAGSVDNFGLVTQRSSTTINGTGDIEVNATERFDGVINGVGNITYDGNPVQVQTTVNGIGRIGPR